MNQSLSQTPPALQLKLKEQLKEAKHVAEEKRRDAENAEQRVFELELKLKELEGALALSSPASVHGQQQQQLQQAPDLSLNGALDANASLGKDSVHMNAGAASNGVPSSLRRNSSSTSSSSSNDNDLLPDAQQSQDAKLASPQGCQAPQQPEADLRHKWDQRQPLPPQSPPPQLSQLPHQQSSTITTPLSAFAAATEAAGKEEDRIKEVPHDICVVEDGATAAKVGGVPGEACVF